MNLLSIGAEARVFHDAEGIVKERVAKQYRHPEIDNALRGFRTRREAKVLRRLQELGFPGPVLHEVDDTTMALRMQFLAGERLRDVLHKNYHAHSQEIGERIAFLHAHNIVHGDLTTSNMMLSNGKIYFIDFGLSQFSRKEEDKAVDLWLLRRALESKHHAIFEECFRIVLEAYAQNYPDAPRVFARLKKVELRGRNRQKMGS